MNQPMMLRIDASALATLFPEGTQARVDLQNAVVAEFIRKNFRDAALGEDVRAKLEAARTDALAEVKLARAAIMSSAIEAAGLKRDRTWDAWKLNPEGQKAVEDAARAVIRNAATEAAEAAMPGVRAKVEDAVRVRINQLIDSEARAAVRKHVEAVINNLPAIGAQPKA